jgi:hypothetical protein
MNPNSSQQQEARHSFVDFLNTVTLILKALKSVGTPKAMNGVF